MGHGPTTKQLSTCGSTRSSIELISSSYGRKQEKVKAVKEKEEAIARAIQETEKLARAHSTAHPIRAHRGRPGYYPAAAERGR
eukprot:scaffold76372_cov31-Tisochrysis_lutea.AAC.2